MEEYHLFRISDLDIRISFKESDKNSMELLPSFETFRIDTATSDLLFSLTVDDNIHLIRKGEMIRKFDTGSGDTLVFLLPDGGYQYIIRNTQGDNCCLLQTNKSFDNCLCALNGTPGMRSFGLNNALMLVFAFAASHYNTLLVHASCVSHNGFAYPFIAKSGTGKSTHSDLWMKYIPDTELINDDNPIIRIIDGTPYLYGSPWSGKTPCYRNIKLPLGAITRIERGKENHIEKLKPIVAFASLLPSCSSMKWDSTIHNNLCNTVTRVIEATPIYTLHCLPDEDAALLCHKTIAK